MALQDLNAEEKRVVFECLKASVEGPFFPDWEFHTLFGLHREEVRDIAERWPVDDERSEDARLAINNAMNNLLGYPHGCEEKWTHYVSVPPGEVGRIFSKWRGERIGRYFDGIM